MIRQKKCHSIVFLRKEKKLIALFNDVKLKRLLFISDKLYIYHYPTSKDIGAKLFGNSNIYKKIIWKI